MKPAEYTRQTDRACDAPMKRPLRVGFAGKRDLAPGFGSTAAGEVALARAVDAALDELAARAVPACGMGARPSVSGADDAASLSSSGAKFVGVSALAMGADTVFAERVLARGGRLRTILPETPDRFFNPADFGNDRAVLERSRRLIDAAGPDGVCIVGMAQTRGGRFAECAAKIVESCDVLLVAVSEEEWTAFEIWRDGDADRALPEGFSAGGSGATLCRALRLGRETLALVPDGRGAWKRVAVRPDRQ